MQKLDACYEEDRWNLNEQSSSRLAMCVATFRVEQLALATAQTFPRDQPERDASGGAILRPCCRIPIMLAVLVPCHSRRWFPGTPQFFKRSASPNRETLKTASTSILCLPPEMSNVNEIITTGTLLVIKLLSRPNTTDEKKKIPWANSGTVVKPGKMRSTSKLPEAVTGKEIGANLWTVFTNQWCISLHKPKPTEEISFVQRETY